MQSIVPVINIILTFITIDSRLILSSVPLNNGFSNKMP